MTERQLLTPKGVRDYLPQEAEWRREVENKIHSVFTSYGYQEVVTPTVEHAKLFSSSNGLDDLNTYRFVDREGQILALRPDMTTPIARVVASRLRNEPLPMRLCYFGNLYRYADPQAGRQREFTQAGVELLGVNGPEADAEIVALACQALSMVGVRDFRMDIGHVGFVHTLLAQAALAGDVEERVKNALVHKDLVDLERLISGHISDEKLKAVFLRLLDLRGGVEVIQEARQAMPDLSIPALNNLEAVYRRLELLGLESMITIDLGMVKAMDYYTGIILEGYSRELGYYLCSGGRYDGLLGEFGYPLPATGFALGLDRVLLVLERQNFDGWHCPVRLRVRFASQPRKEDLEWIERWRLAGITVINDLGIDGASDDILIEFLADGRVHWKSHEKSEIVKAESILERAL